MSRQRMNEKHRVDDNGHDKGVVVVEEEAADNNKLNVKEACKKFLIKSDELLASKLQYDEHMQRYNQNKQLHQANRINIQESLPVAKNIQTSEYRERMESDQLRAQHLIEIEENDKLIAMRLQEEYLAELEQEKMRQQARDNELAARLQQEEIFREKLAAVNKHDEHLAYELQEEERKEYEEMKRLSRRRESAPTTSTTNHHHHNISTGQRRHDLSTKTTTTNNLSEKRLVVGGAAIGVVASRNHQSSLNCVPGVPVKLEASNFSSTSTAANSCDTDYNINKSKLIIKLKFDSLSTSSLSSSSSSSCESVFGKRPASSSERSKSTGNLNKCLYESIEREQESDPERESMMMMMGHQKLVAAGRRNVKSFEKESLIDSASSNYSSHHEKWEFSTLSAASTSATHAHSATTESECGVVEKEPFVSHLIGSVKKSNIVAAIDPTFNKYKISYQEASSDSNATKAKIKKEAKKTAKSEFSNSNNTNSSSFYDNDTDTFLPVQGHKRSSFKSTLATSKKKSQSTCLQQ